MFELAARLADRVTFEFAIDDLNRGNVAKVGQFAATNGLTVHVGRGSKRADALDNGNDDSPHSSDRGAGTRSNASAGRTRRRMTSVLDHVGETTPRLHAARSALVDGADGARGSPNPPRPSIAESIRRADLVLCDSTWERREIQTIAPDRNNARFLPLGCDFREFRPGPLGREAAAPVRGRPGRAEEAVRSRDRRDGATASGPARAAAGRHRQPERRGRATIIPTSCASAIDLRGYVGEEELAPAYAESRGLILLSEFEAFGIPILEALACATPVFLTRIDPTISLFGTYCAAHFCPAEDPEATAEIVGRVLDRGRDASPRRSPTEPPLEAQFDWDHLAEAKWCAMSAAWYRRNCWLWTA